jgi:hypothetical protein
VPPQLCLRHYPNRAHDACLTRPISGSHSMGCVESRQGRWHPGQRSANTVGGAPGRLERTPMTMPEGSPSRGGAPERACAGRAPRSAHAYASGQPRSQFTVSITPATEIRRGEAGRHPRSCIRGRYPRARRVWILESPAAMLIPTNATRPLVFGQRLPFVGLSPTQSGSRTCGAHGGTRLRTA